MHLGLGSQNKILENANGKVMFNYQSSQNISKIFNCTFPTSEKIILGEIIFHFRTFLVVHPVLVSDQTFDMLPFWDGVGLECSCMYTHWGKNEIFVQNFIFYQNLKNLNFCPKIPDFDSKMAKIPILFKIQV